MPFKIVQTIEKGKIYICTVPSAWEEEGVLRWPIQKTEKLRRDPGSIPEENWRKINCALKRGGIADFKAAETLIKNMSDASDTEPECSAGRNRQPQPSNLPQDFNDLVRTCMAKQAQISEPALLDSALLDSDVAMFETEDLSQPITIEQQQLPVISSETTSSSSSELKSSIEELKSSVEALKLSNDNIQNNQGLLCSNQLTILQKLADISTQFEELIKRTSESTFTEKPKEGLDSLQPITNKKGFDELEETLKDKLKAEAMKATLLVVCGHGKGKAINNAYALMDVVFERKFLVGCSWAGGTRAEGSKICFKSYQNTIDFLFDIVHTSDKQFTKLEFNIFFKNLLRNANKRCNSKNLRMSCQKKRQSKQKKTTDTEVASNENLEIEETLDLK